MDPFHTRLFETRQNGGAADDNDRLSVDDEIDLPQQLTAADMVVGYDAEQDMAWLMSPYYQSKSNSIVQINETPQMPDYAWGLVWSPSAREWQ